MKPIAEMDEVEFAYFFKSVRDKILEDPLKYFVKSKGFINFNPSSAQTIILKSVFGQSLDAIVQSPVRMETVDDAGNFNLIEKDFTEVELYEFLTGGRKYENTGKKFNRINLLCGRRCLAEDVEILTPAGPKAIKNIEVGDEVYGYEQGEVRVTKVLKKWDNGIQKVVTLNNYREAIVECTEEHSWLTYDYYNGEVQRKTKNFRKKDQFIRRQFVDIPCGHIHEPHAYAIGALLGDGCAKQRPTSKTRLYISSENDLIPLKVAQVLNASLKKGGENNYTWVICNEMGLNCNHYTEWCKDRYSYEKLVDLKVIDTWDRQSLLAFVAGLIDTDGSIYYKSGQTKLVLNLTNGSKDIIEAFKFAFYKLFQKKLKTYIDDRAKYKNGAIYNVKLANNLIVKRALRELDQHLVCPRKKWKPEYEDLPERNFNSDKIGVLVDRTMKVKQTYDITVGNSTNLYILANEGLITHNSGKSTVASILAIFSTIKINWKPFLSKTPVATVAVLSHSVEFSQEIIDILKQLVAESPVLSRLRDPDRKNTHSTFHLKIPFVQDDGLIEYSCVAIKVGAASKKTTRGRAVCTLLADECCHWALNDDAAESDIEIFRAVTPALAQFKEFGTIIKMSSPAIKSGVMYDEWNRRDEPKIKAEYIQLKAPTWTMNPLIEEEFFAIEMAKDPDGFNTEYRSEFVDSISNFILPEFVDLCVSRGVTFNTPADDRKTIYAAAIDAAFKGDRFAFSLVGYNENRVTMYALKFWEGSKKSPVQIHEVATYIRAICRQYGINEVTSDQYSFQPMRELFLQYGINLIENVFTLPYKRKIYFGLKRLIHNQQIDLLDIPLLAKELKELVVEQTPSGQIRIGHPTGGSDDAADATAVAAFRVMEKAGVVQMTTGEISIFNDYGVKTDITGRAFSAPPVELLHSFAGFSDAVDNSREYMLDPVTGKYRKISEIEDEEGIPSADNGNFIF